MTRSDLIAALRAAAGPDRKLDAEIACAVRHLPEKAPDWLKRWGADFAPISYKGADPGQIAAMHNDGTPGINWTSPRYTASIDAALTLLPDELWWLFGKGKIREDEPLYGVRVFNPVDFEYVIAEAEHATSIAIALCVAALEARKA